MLIADSIAAWTKRWFWTFDILILAVTAYFVAQGVGNLILSDIVEAVGPVDPMPVHMRHRAKPGALVPTQLQYHAEMGEPLLRRNIFDSGTGPIDRDAVQAEEEDFAEDDTIDEVTPCGTSGIQVNSTVASADTPELSFVSLWTNGERRMLHIGDKLNDKEVAWISWRYLFLQDTSSVCYIDLFGDQNRVSSRISHPRALKRRDVNNMFRNPSHFARKLRGRPKQKNGKWIGYELRRVPRRGVLSKLGLRKRDLVLRINGVALTKTKSVADVYRRIKKANTLRISLLRNGVPVQLNIKIL